MTEIDYKSLLIQAFAEYGNLLEKRQEVDLEIAKKRQFIMATMNMLPDDEQGAFKGILDALGGELGLTDAIRKVLQAHPKKSFTATEVRDKLREAKFDFSSYKANPLASIHAVLKRLKPDEAEATEIDGVAAWRWAGDPVPDMTPYYQSLAKMFESTDESPFSARFWGGGESRLKTLADLGGEAKKKK